jgi:DNA-directed RNA polymerase specialized sigma subunit
MLSDIEQITLRDILVTAGLTHRQIEDVFLLLEYKPVKIQRAFYYRACGETQQEIADRLGVTQQQVCRYVSVNCSDIGKYLKSNK